MQTPLLPVDWVILCLRGAGLALYRPTRCNLNGTPIGMIVSGGHPELISVPIMTITHVNTLHYVTPCAY